MDRYVMISRFNLWGPSWLALSVTPVAFIASSRYEEARVGVPSLCIMAIVFQLVGAKRSSTRALNTHISLVRTAFFVAGLSIIYFAPQSPVLFSSLSITMCVMILLASSERVVVDAGEIRLFAWPRAVIPFDDISDIYVTGRGFSSRAEVLKRSGELVILPIGMYPVSESITKRAVERLNTLVVRNNTADN